MPKIRFTLIGLVYLTQPVTANDQRIIRGAQNTYEIIERIGTGHFTQVSTAVQVNDKPSATNDWPRTKLVVRLYNKLRSPEEIIFDLTNHLRLWRIQQRSSAWPPISPRIVRIVDVNDFTVDSSHSSLKERPFVVTEYLGPDLQKRRDEFNLVDPSLSDKQRVNRIEHIYDLTLHLIKAIQELAKIGLVHSDIKPSSIAFRPHKHKWNGETPVLIDFGASRSRDEYPVYGSREFGAPEEKCAILQQLKSMPVSDLCNIGNVVKYIGLETLSPISPHLEIDGRTRKKLERLIGVNRLPERTRSQWSFIYRFIEASTTEDWTQRIAKLNLVAPEIFYIDPGTQLITFHVDIDSNEQTPVFMPTVPHDQTKQEPKHRLIHRLIQKCRAGL